MPQKRVQVSIIKEHEQKQQQRGDGVPCRQYRHVVESCLTEESYEDSDRSEAYAGKKRQYKRNSFHSR